MTNKISDEKLFEAAVSLQIARMNQEHWTPDCDDLASCVRSIFVGLREKINENHSTEILNE